MSLTLHPYQVEGVEWLATRQYALLADAMGLGKTAQALEGSKAIGAYSILVICPAVVVPNWYANCTLWNMDGRFVYVTSYDKAVRDHAILKETAWDLLIVDEAHYLKSRTAKRTKAVLTIPAARVWALSGTPLPNGKPDEIWPLLTRFRATALPYEAFVKRYCDWFLMKHNMIVRGPNKATLPEFKNLLETVMKRRTLDEVSLQLPSLRYEQVRIQGNSLTHMDLQLTFPDLYFVHGAEGVLKMIVKEHEVMSTSLAAFDEYTSIPQWREGALQVLRGFSTRGALTMVRQYFGLQKVRPVASIVGEELDTNAIDKIVLFCHHRVVVRGLQEELKRFKPVTIYGGTPDAKKKLHLKKFRTNPRCRVLIANTAAAGTGIDGLQDSCCEVGIVEADYVPANNAQAIMRVHRQGQKRPVRVRFFSLASEHIKIPSIDEKIGGILMRKTRNLTAIFDEQSVDISTTTVE